MHHMALESLPYLEMAFMLTVIAAVIVGGLVFGAGAFWLFLRANPYFTLQPDGTVNSLLAHTRVPTDPVASEEEREAA